MFISFINFTQSSHRRIMDMEPCLWRRTQVTDKNLLIVMTFNVNENLDKIVRKDK